MMTVCVETRAGTSRTLEPSGQAEGGPSVRPVV